MNIDPQELEQFRLTLPEDLRREYFRWLNTAYPIAEALFLIKKCNLQPQAIDAIAWARAYGLAGPKRNGDLDFNIFNGVSDKDALQPNINPNIPIILVNHSYKKGRERKNVILCMDGNKRLRKAILEGRAEIKAYYLEEKLAKLIRR